MNPADQKINELDKTIIGIDTSSMICDSEKNHKGDLLVCLSKTYQNEIYVLELLICLKPGTGSLSEENLSMRSIELKHKKNPNKEFKIIHSHYQKNLIVESGKSPIYTRSENNDLKYPRARNIDSFEEQNKAHKIVIRGTNSIMKLLSNQT